jgi:hypothetical protein
MNTLSYLDADYPWDIRIEKVPESLADAGHSVHLMCRKSGCLTRSGFVVQPTINDTTRRLTPTY